MPPNSVILSGREAGREFARPWYEQLDIEFDISVDEIEVHGDWAFARWSYVGRYTPKAGGDTTEAIASLQRAVNVDPRHGEAQYVLGKLLFEQGKLDYVAMKDALGKVTLHWYLTYKVTNKTKKSVPLQLAIQGKTDTKKTYRAGIWNAATRSQRTRKELYPGGEHDEANGRDGYG